TIAVTPLCITIGESRHAQIMRTSAVNVTCGVIRFQGWRTRQVHTHAGKPGYRTELADSVAPCSCSTDSLSRSPKSFTICSTKVACDRGKTNRYFGPFPAAGRMTRFSERNLGSRATFDPSRSIPRVNGRPAFRATKVTLRGSSFVATSAPNKFAGICRPRPLTHGTAQTMVSPRTFSLPKMGASRVGNVDGRLSGTSRSAGPFSFLQASQIFTFIARKILGAK